ncbi:VOC family protein [Blastococcus mobilis]|uniref:Catechol 2,3-dioxygenase n=1 Tax=Blastococcus mobilis TaxID=1938746 RepID=A0A238Y3N5_9ACTN|nr:VOC family protein [Blastococcus mobilis]SNR65401.1 Catechol 2,3-dioxygenase [Blastococcus mobilis]
MTVELTKDSIDLGVVTKDPAACLAFYRDVLGLKDLGESPMPGGTMHRLGCGTSVIKLISPRKPPAAEAPPGGLRGGTGYRYWTISVSNLPEVVAAAESAGHPVVVPPTELRPGVSIAMIEDPDGNWVELLTGE